MDKGTCCHAWWHEFQSLYLHGGKERKRKTNCWKLFSNLYILCSCLWRWLAVASSALLDLQGWTGARLCELSNPVSPKAAFIRELYLSTLGAQDSYLHSEFQVVRPISKKNKNIQHKQKQSPMQKNKKLHKGPGIRKTPEYNIFKNSLGLERWFSG